MHNSCAVANLSNSKHRGFQTALSHFFLTETLIILIDYYKLVRTDIISFMRANFGLGFGDSTSYVYRHAFAQLFFWCSFYYLMPAISAKVAIETGWPVLHLSITFTLAFLVWAACAPLVGICMDRGWGGKVMFAGGIMGALALFVLSSVTNRWAFSGSLLFLGMSMAATLYDPCFAILMRKFEIRGVDATATVTLIAGFATLLTFPLVLGLSNILVWREIILVFAVLAVFAVFLLPKQDREKPENEIAKDMSRFKIQKAPLLIAIAFGLIMMSHAILLFLIPVVLAQGNGIGSVGILAVAILGPAQIAGRLAWKVIGTNYAPQLCAVVLFVVFCLPPVILILTAPSAGMVYVALIVQGACYGVHTILRPVLARLYLPIEHLGRGFGIIATIGLVMMALGPAIGGLVWSVTGFGGLMMCILVLNVMALCLVAIVSKIGFGRGAA